MAAGASLTAARTNRHANHRPPPHRANPASGTLQVGPPQGASGTLQSGPAVSAPGASGTLQSGPSINALPIGQPPGAIPWAYGGSAPRESVSLNYSGSPWSYGGHPAPGHHPGHQRGQFDSEGSGTGPKALVHSGGFFGIGGWTNLQLALLCLGALALGGWVGFSIISATQAVSAAARRVRT
jgi:hypothetical protein